MNYILSQEIVKLILNEEMNNFNDIADNFSRSFKYCIEQKKKNRNRYCESNNNRNENNVKCFIRK